MTRRLTILVVEDSRPIARMMAVVLEQAGHTVIAAADGIEALERLDQMTPDLVLTDIDLPGMNGLELRQRLLDDPRRQRLPVIAVTAEANRAAFMDRGFFGHLQKPFEVTKLSQYVEAFAEAGDLIQMALAS